MKNRDAFPLNCLSDILLLFINSVGVVGAMTESLEIPWRTMGENGTAAGGNGLNHIAFWGGLFLFCMAAVLLRSGSGGKKVLVRVMACLTGYLFLGAFFREALAEGVAMTLQNAVANLNGRYAFHITWPFLSLRTAAGQSSDGMMWLMTFSTLYFLFPLELLAGLLGRYDKGFCLIMGNALWFTTACICDLFPGYVFLAVCVLGIVATVIQKDFRERPGVGIGVSGCAMVLTGLVMMLIFRIGLPLMDRKYEEMLEDREEFYRMVNEDWIPGIRNLLPGYGSGPDVTGQLGRKNMFAYTAEEVYRVTVDSRPQSALYLKGFVGGTYGSEAWIAQTDGELEAYYQENGMELPENYGTLVNISHEALKALHRNELPAQIGIEELGGRGSYSIYPYGALMTEEMQVHGDGSVERKNAEYGFQYYAQSGFGRQEMLSEAWREEEERYRRYVYDSFLEYPEEKLPLFTERINQEEIRTDNIYVCILDIIHFLGRQAEYNLDAGNNPSGTDFVEYFLFESREGYCVHFASAAVLALRYFGIPARYVAGYSISPSEFTVSPEGNYTAVLTGRHAHAWAEVYLDSIGWVPVEMTPGAVALSGDNRMEQLGELGRLTGQWLVMAGNDALQTDKPLWQYGDGEEEEGAYGQKETEKTGQEEQAPGDGMMTGGLQEPAEEDISETGGGKENEVQAGMPEEPNLRAEYVKSTGFKMFCAVLWAAFLISLLVCMEKSVLCRRRERFLKMPPGERIFLLYRNLRKTLQAAGCPGKLDADGEEFRRIIREKYGVGQEEYEIFCRILEKNSFSGEEPSGEEADRIFYMYHRLAERAYEQAPFYKKPLIQRYRSYVSEGKKDVGSRAEQV